METGSRYSVTAMIAFVAIILALRAPSVAAFDLTSCSTQNTGTDEVLNTIYLSLGKCHDNCLGADYAFGVVQGDACWCSNYAPASTVDLSECYTKCPGWPYEFCASTSAGVYGYIALSKKPLGTAGESESESGAAPSTGTVLATASTAFQVTSTTTTPPTAAGSSTSSPSSTDLPNITVLQTPYVSIKTVLGSAQTVTISPTNIQVPAETQPPLPSSEPSDQNSFWGNTGKVAGTFTVVGLIIAGIIGAGIFFLFRRYRKSDDAMTVGSNEDQPTSSNGAPYMVDRRRSNLTLATGGLAGLTRGSSHEKSPVENNKTPASMSRRGSIPMGHDQRLNPAALYTAHANGSHVSVNTFQDDRDYSRPVLHVRNPDH